MIPTLYWAVGARLQVPQGLCESAPTFLALILLLDKAVSFFSTCPRQRSIGVDYFRYWRLRLEACSGFRPRELENIYWPPTITLLYVWALAPFQPCGLPSMAHSFFMQTCGGGGYDAYPCHTSSSHSPTSRSLPLDDTEGLPTSTPELIDLYYEMMETSDTSVSDERHSIDENATTSNQPISSVKPQLTATDGTLFLRRSL